MERVNGMVDGCVVILPRGPVIVALWIYILYDII